MFVVFLNTEFLQHLRPCLLAALSLSLYHACDSVIVIFLLQCPHIVYILSSLCRTLIYPPGNQNAAIHVAGGLFNANIIRLHCHAGCSWIGYFSVRQLFIWTKNIVIFWSHKTLRHLPYKNTYEILTVSQLMLQVLSIICFSCSVMDIKELKFLDIGPTVTKPDCEQGASTETSCVPSGGHNQTSRVTHPPEASSVSHSSTVPTTILRRGGYISDQC